MIKIYDFSPDDFQQPENSEFMIVIKTETRELKGYDGFTMESFQNLVEHIRYGLNKNRFSTIEQKLIHYDKKNFDKNDFLEEYNKHIYSLNTKNQNDFRFLNVVDLIKYLFSDQMFCPVTDITVVRLICKLAGAYAPAVNH